MKKRSMIAALAAACTLAALPMPSSAQAAAWPSRPVTIIVPFPPGGTSDLMGRITADVLQKQLKQTFIVDNRAGAGGAIGVGAAARAPADGYTLLLSGIGSNAVIHGYATPKPSYTEADFIHVSEVAAGPNVLVVTPSFPAKTFKEFIAYVKGHPGQANYGQVNASSGALTTEYLKQVAGIDITGIPYKGGAPALQDVLAGQIPMMFTNQDAALPHVRAGKLRALAVTGAERNPLYPDVPTVAESGYPGFEAVSWTGISVPKNTPRAIVDQLEAAMNKGFADPAVRARLEATGFVVLGSKSADYTKLVNGEVARWKKVIETGGLKNE